MASRRERWKSEEAAAITPEMGEPVAEEPTPSVSVVVEGAAAHDPLAHPAVSGPPVLSLGAWLQAMRLRNVESAAFAAWARAHLPNDLPSDEWTLQLVKFQKTPIK